MSGLLIRGGILVLPDRLVNGDVLIQKGKIARIGSFPPPKGIRTLDARGLYVSPGFIDTHVNGGGGRGFMENTEEAFEVAIRFHIQHGTTGLLPTAIAAPLEVLRKFLELVDEYCKRNHAVLGAHLNGPFVSPKRAGAMNPRYILSPSLGTFRELTRNFEKTIKVVTLAPEVEGAQEVVAAVLGIGAVPSLGHSDATYEETLQALKWGVRHFTHIFNAMRELGHREPGPVGAALEEEGVTMELIADGVHVHPVLVRLLYKLKRGRGICLVTDAISAAGQPDGEYCLGDVRIIVRKAIATTEAGTLAGSTLTMNRAVKNFMEFTGCSLPEAVRCASLNPAQLLGVDGQKGSLEVGKDADLVIFDEDFNVHYTILAGELAYARR